jgi:hypothetical protein
MSDWEGADWLENPIYVRSHVEGKYSELTRQLVTKIDHETGETRGYYLKGPMRERFTIPFNKKAVDKILDNEHPFGEDSISLTDRDRIIFIGKFVGERGMQTMRCSDYDYNQFVTPEWSTFKELALQKGGPAARISTEKEGYIK